MRDALAARVAAAQALAAAATPGPWRVSDLDTVAPCVSSEHYPLLHVHGDADERPWVDDWEPADPQPMADAELIAAAPDLAALVAELWAEVEALRQGIAPCVDDDGTPFASARYWRAANAEACRRLAESRKTVLELRTERDEARAEAARLRALCATVPTWGEQGAGLGDDLPSTPTEED